MKTISLPAVNKSISIRQYIDAVKLAKENKDKEFKHTFNQWWPGYGYEIVQEFVKAIHDRINQQIPYNQR